MCHFLEDVAVCTKSKKLWDQAMACACRATAFPLPPAPVKSCIFANLDFLVWDRVSSYSMVNSDVILEHGKP